MSTKGLTLQSGGHRLIGNINLTIGPGTLTVVMGANGAGKSLLLRLLHGLIAPTSGAILWGGQPLDAAIRRRQAMVFQRPVVLRRSVAANIDFVLGLRGKRANKTERDELLAHVGLLGQARQPARLLSGGEQQRLALARALALQPEILFLDEPTASLDPASTVMIEDIVMRAHRQGTKVFFVTHDIGQARRLADDVVFLYQGTVTEAASAENFFKAPASEAAQAYVDGRIVL
ncbi:MAG TPA: ATP-binding cassette domain-containing protein [Hyphomicrobiaceae bacterium]|nr:ATP-binding cassette domain-containing protein [Hyphomicrobiaceae bacterium]